MKSKKTSNLKNNLSSPLTMMIASLVLGSAALGFNATPLNVSIDNMASNALATASGHNDFSPMSVANPGTVAASSTGY